MGSSGGCHKNERRNFEHFLPERNTRNILLSRDKSSTLVFLNDDTPAFFKSPSCFIRFVP